MLRPTTVAILALCAPFLVAAAGTSSASAATTRSCRSVKDVGPTGRDPADAVSIRATRTSCATARSIARRWGGEVVRQSPGPVHVGRYVCRDTTSPSTGRFSVRCTGPGSRLVRFKLG